MSDNRKLTAGDIIQMLRNRYSGHEWAFVAEVPNGTGSAMNRRCDGLAMGLWPSKGLHLHGHEIKVSRSDWLTEIQDVTKSAAFSVYCHYWWIVATANVVKIDELPSDWGWMCPVPSGSLRVKKPATLTQPEMPTHSLLAGIFRASLKSSVSEAELKTARQDGYSDGYDEARKRYNKPTTPQYDSRAEALQRSVDAFEKASGIAITSYGGGQIGKLVRIVQEVGPDAIQRWLDGVESNLTRTHERVAAANQHLRELLNT